MFNVYVLGGGLSPDGLSKTGCPDRVPTAGLSKTGCPDRVPTGSAGLVAPQERVGVWDGRLRNGGGRRRRGRVRRRSKGQQAHDRRRTKARFPKPRVQIAHRPPALSQINNITQSLQRSEPRPERLAGGLGITQHSPRRKARRPSGEASLVKMSRRSREEASSRCSKLRRRPWRNRAAALAPFCKLLARRAQILARFRKLLRTVRPNPGTLFQNPGTAPNPKPPLLRPKLTRLEPIQLRRCLRKYIWVVAPSSFHQDCGPGFRTKMWNRGLDQD